MKIAFRVDASMQIGTGHVVRCITLAEALRDRGANCRFICRNFTGNLFDRIRQSGLEVLSLPANDRTDLNDLAPEQTALAHAHWLGVNHVTDATQTIALLQGIRPDLLIIDHYALDHQWETKLRPYCERIMVIDDLADRLHDCDFLLDQNLIGDKEARYERLVPDRCTQLLGPRYALLQRRYSVLHPCTPPRVDPIRRIFVSFGGVDTHDLVARTVESFLAVERPDISLDLAVSSVDSYSQKIVERVKSRPNISILKGLTCLADVMAKADLAIGAGGATQWERCCMGLYSLVITVAENQRKIAEFLDKSNIARYVGHFDRVTVNDLKLEIQRVTTEPNLRIYSLSCKEVTNGKGAEFVAQFVTSKFA